MGSVICNVNKKYYSLKIDCVLELWYFGYKSQFDYIIENNSFSIICFKLFSTCSVDVPVNFEHVFTRNCKTPIVVELLNCLTFLTQNNSTAKHFIPPKCSLLN